MSGSNPFALIEVENAVIAQKRDLLLLAGFLVFLLDPFPEHDHMGLFALANAPALLLALLEGDVFVVEPTGANKVSPALSVRYYCDNLSEDRKKYFER